MGDPLFAFCYRSLTKVQPFCHQRLTDLLLTSWRIWVIILCRLRKKEVVYNGQEEAQEAGRQA